jgi:DMSO/TMAO reductase YedYZ molybdopterin-dependent catalytic subunit
LIRSESLARTTRLSSAAAGFGLLFHYLAFYTVRTPLLTDQISEWIMARTPSRAAVAILSTLGPWSKPCAATGALAILGFFLFVCRLLGGPTAPRWRAATVAAAGMVSAALLCYATGYSSTFGALTFWAPAIAVITLVSPETSDTSTPERRRFLSAIMGAGVIAVAGESFLRESLLQKQAAVPVDLFPFQPTLAGRGFGGGLVRKEITAVSEFYGMSKNAIDPVIDLHTWRLKITVDGALLRSIGFGELLELSREYRYVTLRCISNTLKSDLMGTAQWGGVHLSQLVDRRLLPKNIHAVAFVGVDGHDDSLKLDYAFSSDSLLALGMNGKTLSRTHGFPLRLLAPNYYGCRNVKWLGEIRFVSKPYYGTWQRLGYTSEPVVNICSHIDHMRRDGNLLQFGGVSFAGTRGVRSVRVRAQGGPWQPAKLEQSISPYAWTRWIAQVSAGTGAVVEANAEDNTGAWQDLNPVNPFPNGPSGPTIVIARL